MESVPGNERLVIRGIYPQTRQCTRKFQVRHPEKVASLSSYLQKSVMIAKHVRCNSKAGIWLKAAGSIHLYSIPQTIFPLSLMMHCAVSPLGSPANMEQFSICSHILQYGIL